jgi:hypothetical protein
MRDTTFLQNANVSPFSQGSHKGLKVTYRGPISSQYDMELKNGFEADGYVFLADHFEPRTNLRDVYFKKPEV